MRGNSRKLVAQGGNLNTRQPGRQHPHVLVPDSPRRPEIQEEVRQGVRRRSGKLRTPNNAPGTIPN
jgi:hypothetical protein